MPSFKIIFFKLLRFDLLDKHFSKKKKKKEELKIEIVFF